VNGARTAGEGAHPEFAPTGRALALRRPWRLSDRLSLRPSPPCTGARPGRWLVSSGGGESWASSGNTKQGASAMPRDASIRTMLHTSARHSLSHLTWRRERSRRVDGRRISDATRRIPSRIEANSCTRCAAACARSVAVGRMFARRDRARARRAGATRSVSPSFSRSAMWDQVTYKQQGFAVDRPRAPRVCSPHG
jgi:hypothetical protein